MKFTRPNAEIFIPDGKPEAEALKRTTHMSIGAHQDDLEIGMPHGIIECFGQKEKWFLGVTVTNGAGSARSGIYASTTDEEMQKIRQEEQRRAAVVGRYAAMVQLMYSSSDAKSPANKDIVADLKAIFSACHPSVVYTHNPADKHDTHVGVGTKVIKALREMPASARPKKVIGMEVWRNLDWMNDDDKVVLDMSEHENLAMSLVGLFDSQVAGGKRYDLAVMGRRRMNASFFASHDTDTSTMLAYGMDLTPLITDPSLDITNYTTDYIDKFKADVVARLKKIV